MRAHERVSPLTLLRNHTTSSKKKNRRYFSISKPTTQLHDVTALMSRQETLDRGIDCSQANFGLAFPATWLSQMTTSPLSHGEHDSQNTIEACILCWKFKLTLTILFLLTILIFLTCSYLFLKFCQCTCFNLIITH